MNYQQFYIALINLKSSIYLIPNYWTRKGYNLPATLQGIEYILTYWNTPQRDEAIKEVMAQLPGINAKLSASASGLGALAADALLSTSKTPQTLTLSPAYSATVNAGLKAEPFVSNPQIIPPAKVATSPVANKSQPQVIDIAPGQQLIIPPQVETVKKQQPIVATQKPKEEVYATVTTIPVLTDLPAPIVSSPVLTTSDAVQYSPVTVSADPNSEPAVLDNTKPESKNYKPLLWIGAGVAALTLIGFAFKSKEKTHSVNGLSGIRRKKAIAPVKTRKTPAGKSRQKTIKVTI